MNALVIGGSAGAFAALEAILSRLAPDCAVPIIVVQHLHADDDGLFAEHLGRTSALPVVEAEDKTPLMPGRVHVAPAGYHLLVEDKATLALSVDPPVNWSRPAIDVLFESAARVWGADLVAVLLSGANADGTAGLSAVKAAGGRTLVQAPASAEAKLMPDSAIAAGVADEILAPTDIAARLNAWSKPT